MVMAVLGEKSDNATLLMDFEMVATTLVIQHKAISPTSTKYGKEYLIDYGKAIVGPFKSAEEANEYLTKQSKTKK